MTRDELIAQALAFAGTTEDCDGSVAEIPLERCPNGHPLRYPNVIVAHWPKPGTGQLVRCWHSLYLQGHDLRRVIRSLGPGPGDAAQPLGPMLDEAWSVAWQESAGTEPGQSREEPRPRGRCTGVGRRAIG